MTTASRETRDLAAEPSRLGVLPEPIFIGQLPPKSDPRGIRNGRFTALRRLLLQVRQRPAEWALLMVVDRTTCQSISGQFGYGAFGPAADWETALRGDPETPLTRFYVRYVGEPS